MHQPNLQNENAGKHWNYYQQLLLSVYCIRESKITEWVRNTVIVPKEEGLLEMVRKWYWGNIKHWKRPGDNLVLATPEGEICGRRGQRRFEWINIRNCKRRNEQCKEESQTSNVAVVSVHTPLTRDQQKTIQMSYLLCRCHCFKIYFPINPFSYLLSIQLNGKSKKMHKIKLVCNTV